MLHLPTSTHVDPPAGPYPRFPGLRSISIAALMNLREYYGRIYFTT